MGFELVDLEIAKEPAGRFLRLYVEKASGIDLNDLEVYHKKVQPLFEDVDYDYMEVASPGVDRPLKKPRDYERAEGSLIELKFYRPIEGEKLVTGTLIGLFDDTVRIETDGGEKEYRLKDIALAKPVVEFDESEINDVDLAMDDDFEDMPDEVEE